MKDISILEPVSAGPDNARPAPGFSRRSLLAGASALGAAAMACAVPVRAAITSQADYAKAGPYGGNTLPPGVTVRLVPDVNGLTVNMLQAGTPGRPLVLLLHGYPNLAYSWRKLMPALAAAGYYVVAPDIRGFGRTTGYDNSFDADPVPFLTLGTVRDQIALVHALGYHKVEMIVGHDFGSGIAVNSAPFAELSNPAQAFDRNSSAVRTLSGPWTPSTAVAAASPAATAAISRQVRRRKPASASGDHRNDQMAGIVDTATTPAI